jgi:hypothetical protein
MLTTNKCHFPYCGEIIELLIDPSEPFQEYIEDCFVCCRPITITVSIETIPNSVSKAINENNESNITVYVRSENE